MLAVFPNYVFNKNFFEIFTVVSPILLAHQLKISNRFKNNYRKIFEKELLCFTYIRLKFCVDNLWYT